MKASMQPSQLKINRILLSIGIVILVVTLALLLTWLGLSRDAEDRPTVSDVTTPSMKGTPIATPNPSIDVGEGIKLEKLSFACGNYPEDGSDEFLPDVLCATFTNEGTKTLQYANVNVTVDGNQYYFAFSTLPPGESVCVFESNRARTPLTADESTVKPEVVLCFDNEPDLMKDQLEIEVENGYISVKNITSEQLIGELIVYFKNTSGSSYLGGITYRVRITNIDAGEIVSGYSSHAFKDCSEIMFVEFNAAND